MTKKVLDDETIRAIIQRATNIADEVEDRYRLKAFEAILLKLWDVHGKEVVPPKGKEDHKEKAEDRRLAAIKGFADKCDVSVKQLKNVYEFQEDKPVFIVGLRGSHAERQVLVSRYLLAAYDEVYGEKWIGLREVLEAHGISSLANLSANLKRHSEVFRLKGRRKAREYRLVDAAKRETFGMIHELASTGVSE